jgi:hypothetical protein
MDDRKKNRHALTAGKALFALASPLRSMSEILTGLYYEQSQPLTQRAVVGLIQAGYNFNMELDLIAVTSNVNPPFRRANNQSKNYNYWE